MVSGGRGRFPARFEALKGRWEWTDPSAAMNVVSGVGFTLHTAMNRRTAG